MLKPAVLLLNVRSILRWVEEIRTSSQNSPTPRNFIGGTHSIAID